ncbi:MAG: hypothetical protein IBX45_10625 [Campylobacterales bacterium]|nr:hypothetical protein [Campylobacterales bacterium]
MAWLITHAFSETVQSLLTCKPKTLYNTLTLTQGFPILPFHTPLTEQFRLFCHHNAITDPATALELFAIFGGLDDVIDPNKPLETLIEEHILVPYKQLHSLITHFTGSNPLYHKVLTGVAQGDGRTAFKRANIGPEEGMRAVDAMREAGFLRTETCFRNLDQERLSFTLPFFRFWFAFVSPLFKGITQGDYAEFSERFAQRRGEFTQRTFEQLSQAFVQESIEGAMSVRSFWNSSLYIPLIVTCKDGTTLVGTLKHSAQKMKKSDLSALQTLAKNANITADGYVLVAKGGFSSELKNQPNVHLFTLKHLKHLM